MKGSCRTGKTLKVDDITRRYAKNARPKSLNGSLVLKKRHVYLFRLDARLNLTDTLVEGKATARSSIGRLDVLARLLANESDEFDHITPGYVGDLYLEVTPITFDLEVKPGMALSQLRFFRGGDHLLSLSREGLTHEDSFPIVDSDGNPMRDTCANGRYATTFPFCLELALDPHAKCSGFMAKDDIDEPVDPTSERAERYDPSRFWERVSPNSKGALKLIPDRLYILRSKERLKLPGHLALECQAYTETMGEWRIEYAGFAHPFFGYTRPEGTPLMFEVRGHNVPTLLTDGIPLGNVSFKRMSRAAKEPEKPGTYEGQELKLSSCFQPWPD